MLSDGVARAMHKPESSIRQRGLRRLCAENLYLPAPTVGTNFGDYLVGLLEGLLSADWAGFREILKARIGVAGLQAAGAFWTNRSIRLANGSGYVVRGD